MPTSAMQSFLFTSSCCLLVLGSVHSSPVGPVVRSTPKKNDREQLQAEETIGSYSGGLGSLHSLYSPTSGGHGGGLHTVMPALHNLGDSYDSLHKYGGIGNKKFGMPSLYDHGSKGYKNYYGDAQYGNQGLNKYSSNQQSDKYGGKSGKHDNYHDGHVYTRNRGYGYEKHYMYDKEYSNSKHGGSKGGYHSYYGDHKKDGKSSVKAYKNYGGKKFGVKKSHDDHNYGKYGHLMDDHDGGYVQHVPETAYVTQHVPLTVTQHMPVSVTQHVPVAEYVPVGVPVGVPVIEQYGGALGHGGPSYSDSHSGDSGMLEYDTQHILPSSASMSYVPSASSSASTLSSLEPEGEPGGKLLSASSITSGALISTKLATPPATPPVYATIGDTMRVNSAVHATPAVISTSSGTHYYNS